MTLYIDTHLNEIDIALINNMKIIDRIIKDNVLHTEVSVNSIKEILDNNELTVKDIDEIIVINGPGSFTGVRIGVVIAKIMGYSLNIPVKSISFLQAVALKYSEVNVAITDKNGAFVGKFLSDHSLVGEYSYIKNAEWDSMSKNNYVINDNVDVLKVVEFLSDKPSVDIHALSPLYIKNIEV